MPNARKYTTYSLADTHAAINDPHVGAFVCSDETAGSGRIVLAHAGDLSSHTKTANGYVVVNRLHDKSGSFAIETAQNSPLDMYLRRLASYYETAPTDQTGDTGITLLDSASGIQITMTGCSLQKRPDRSYDQTAANISYTFLVAELTEN